MKATDNFDHVSFKSAATVIGPALWLCCSFLPLHAQEAWDDGGWGKDDEYWDRSWNADPEPGWADDRDWEVWGGDSFVGTEWVGGGWTRGQRARDEGWEIEDGEWGETYGWSEDRLDEGGFEW